MPATYEIPGGALRGMGYSMLPAAISVLGSCGFRFVWIYTVFARVGGFGILMDVYLATWILTGSMMLIAYSIISRREYNKKTKVSASDY